MGMEVHRSDEEETPEAELENLRVVATRPSILLVGPPAVGKRSLLHRLVAKKTRPSDAIESGVLCQGWTIDTKYYTADVCVWIARPDSSFVENGNYKHGQYGRSQALVMVFDLSKSSTFKELQLWAEKVQLENFEILLCVGNKADHVPDHFAHAEYRRKMQKGGESSSDPHPEFWDFGIDRTEGSSLLAEEDSTTEEEERRARITWCSERGIEYIEACALNEDFDKCMSVDGDLQGVARVHGALCAHMWPGLVMKDKSLGPERSTSSPGQEGSSSDDDSDYNVEYELLSDGSAEPWDGSGWEEQWTQAPTPETGVTVQDNREVGSELDANGMVEGLSSLSSVSRSVDSQAGDAPSDLPNAEEEQSKHGEGDRENQNEARRGPPSGSDASVESDFNAMEQLMSDMTVMRDNMRNISDHSRREMAAQLAMRMAFMFCDEDGSDG